MAQASKQFRIGLDVDGVIGDFVKHTLATLEKVGYDVPRPQDVHDWNLEGPLGPIAYRAATKEWRKPGWCYNMPRREGAAVFVEALRERGELFLVTAPMRNAPYWIAERTAWAQRWFALGHDRIIYSHEKYKADVDFLIDDKVSNVNAWFERRGPSVVLFDSGLNEGQRSEIHPSVPIASSFDDALAIIDDKTSKLSLNLGRQGVEG